MQSSRARSSALRRTRRSSAALTSIDGPIVLASRSYGGAGITNADGIPNVTARVYIPDSTDTAQESLIHLMTMNPAARSGTA
jgi:hypothetical protein